MGTHAAIGFKNTDGTVTGVYCHFDGYVSYVGRRLFEYYNTEEKVLELLKHGNMSTLGTCVGEKHDFDNRGDQTTYYGRDRGDPDEETRTFSSTKEFVNEIGASYAYLFIDGQWFLVDGLETPMSLENAIELGEDE